MDDGTTTRIEDKHYHMTTTTAQAANVLSHLEYYLQVVWPELNVNVVSTTEQWAGAAIAGPKSRNVLSKLFPDLNVSNQELPFMGYTEGNLFGVHARVFRISFSGELAYEINVNSDSGLFMWEKIIGSCPRNRWGSNRSRPWTSGYPAGSLRRCCWDGSRSGPRSLRSKPRECL